MDLVIDRLHAGYPGRPVLRDVSLRLDGGKVTAVVGANGCGKSTLLRCMAGLHASTSGVVRIAGEDVRTMKPNALARRVGFLPQLPQAPAGITVRLLASYGRHPHRGMLSPWSEADEAAVHEALRRTDLLGLADRPLDQLSGGQRQRAWLAMVLAQTTPVLMLDEPASMLDLGHQLQLLTLIGELAAAGRTVVMVLHDLSSAARHADMLVALDQGCIAASGPPREVLTPALVRRLYGIDAHVLHAPDDGAPVVVPMRAIPPQAPSTS